jgi:hypothetical protein
LTFSTFTFTLITIASSHNHVIIISHSHLRRELANLSPSYHADPKPTYTNDSIFTPSNRPQMATSTPNRRTSQRPTRAQSIQSIQSDSSFTTPRPTPPPPPHRLGRGVRANSIVIEIASPSVADTTNEIDERKSVVRLLPAHYLLPPTHPSPYEGSLERSLDAIQDWGRLHMSANGVTQGKSTSLVCYERYAR